MPNPYRAGAVSLEISDPDLQSWVDRFTASPVSGASGLGGASTSPLSGGLQTDGGNPWSWDLDTGKGGREAAGQFTGKMMGGLGGAAVDYLGNVVEKKWGNASKPANGPKDWTTAAPWISTVKDLASGTAKGAMTGGGWGALAGLLQSAVGVGVNAGLDRMTPRRTTAPLPLSFASRQYPRLYREGV